MHAIGNSRGYSLRVSYQSKKYSNDDRRLQQRFDKVILPHYYHLIKRVQTDSKDSTIVFGEEHFVWICNSTTFDRSSTSTTVYFTHFSVITRWQLQYDDDDHIDDNTAEAQDGGVQFFYCNAANHSSLPLVIVNQQQCILSSFFYYSTATTMAAYTIQIQIVIDRILTKSIIIY